MLPYKEMALVHMLPCNCIEYYVFAIYTLLDP